MKKISIFEEQIARKPDNYPWTSDFIDAMWEGHWTPNEFNFHSDIQNFKIDLTEEERGVVIRTLSAIGQIEIAVKKFWSRLGDNLPHPSITDLGLVMAHIEVIHNRAYEKLLNVLHLHDAFEENLKLDVIGGRVKYLRKYLNKEYKDNRKQYIYSLILFTLFVENVSLFSQFYVVAWFNRYKNVLKDTAQQVQYTAKEEMVHAQVGIKLLQVIKKEHPELFDQELEDKIIHEAEEAFKAESKIIDWMLGEYSGTRINREVLKEYVKSRINDSLVQIGFKSIFEIDSSLVRDFEWMDEEILGNSATDFFHKRPVEYSKSQSVSVADLFDV
jgi:ribonucleoside-diphosphate reductase beta chain